MISAPELRYPPYWWHIYGISMELDGVVLSSLRMKLAAGQLIGLDNEVGSS